MSSDKMANTDRARAELHSTLDLLSQRLDYPTRIDNALSRGKRRIERQQRNNPLAFAAGVTAVSLLAGAVVVGVALAVTRRISE